MYMPSIFNNSVFDNFDNWMDFSFPSPRDGLLSRMPSSA